MKPPLTFIIDKGYAEHCNVTPTTKGKWITCQIGAREDYAVPRIFKSYGILQSFVTDIWAPAYMHPFLKRFKFTRRFRERFNSNVGDADVRNFNWRFITQAALSHFKPGKNWDYTCRVNRDFARNAAKTISEVVQRHEIQGVFAYSYAALEVFETAKRLGLKTILGQIDAGQFAENIYSQATRQFGGGEPRSRPPKAYWDLWRKECDLADLIVVNSDWSKQALETVGLSRNKIKVIPVAFDTNEFFNGERENETRIPQRFSSAEPLKIIFVGSVSIEKGIHHLIRAAIDLRSQPVLFQVVGAINMNLGVLKCAPDNMQFVGSVPRNSVINYLKQAHMLVFPSLSDGFGIVQLEAHALGIPVIASQYCGKVVVDGRTGMILPDLGFEAISSTIRSVIDRPEKLSYMSRQALERVKEFCLASVGAMWMREVENIETPLQISP